MALALPGVSGPAVESASLAGGSIFSQASFLYDGDDKRVESTITTDQGATTTYFIGNYYELSGTVVTKYYYAGSQRIAMRVGGTLSFLLTDHLGSVVAVTDATGSLISQQRYLPFGQVRTDVGSVTATDFGYSGQRSLSMGLMDYAGKQRPICGWRTGATR